MKLKDLHKDPFDRDVINAEQVDYHKYLLRVLTRLRSEKERLCVMGGKLVDFLNDKGITLYDDKSSQKDPSQILYIGLRNHSLSCYANINDLDAKTLIFCKKRIHRVTSISLAITKIEKELGIN